MALTGGAIMQVDSTDGSASDALNAGYFNAAGSSAGTDYSLTAPIAATDLVIGGTNTTVTSATIGFAAAHVRNGLRITAGTNFTVGLYEIISVAAGVATLDRACGTAGSTGGTARVGGALASPGIVGSLTAFVSNIVVYIKYNATAYSCSSTSNVANGRLNPGGTLIWVGYDTTRTRGNTDANRPTLNATSATMTLLSMSGGGAEVHNLSFDNSGSNASVTLVNCSALVTIIRRCKFRRSTTSGLTVSGNSTRLSDLEFDTNSGTQALSITGSTTAAGISVRDCSASSGITVSVVNQASMIADCLVANYTGTGTCFNFSVNSMSLIAVNCTGHGSGANPSHIFQCSGHIELRNCLAMGGAGLGRGFTNNVAATDSRLVNCAAWDNDGGTHNFDADQVEGFVTLSADPFEAAGTDFRLNSTAGGGAACRGVGAPATYGGYAAANAPDIGAYQHADPAASAGGYIPFGGAFSHIREH